MAINLATITQQIKPRSSTRIRERDYTIPDRLNQPVPVRISRKLPETLINQTFLSNFISTLFESRRMMQQQISPNKFKWVFVATFLILTLTSNTKVCHCDTQLPATINSNSINNNQQSSYLLSTQHQQTTNTKNRLPIQSPATSSATKTSQPTTSQKEHLLAKLSNSIELQHFKLKPPRALMHERPSKHDSGDEDLGMSFNFATSVKSKNSAATNKADDSMQQIVRMHESHAQHNQPQTGAANKPAAEQPASKRWRDLSHGPMREMASVLMKPNSLMTQAMSYISPLVVGSKLTSADSSSSNQDNKQSSNNPTSNAPASGEKNTLLSGLHTFGGRSGTNQPPATTLPITKGLWPLGKSLFLRPFATVSPQTSSLARPSKGFEHSTRPTTIFESGNFRSHNSQEKSAAASHKQSSDPLADLLADSSDFSAVLAPVAGLLSQFPAAKPIQASYSSVVDESAKKSSLATTASSNEISPSSEETPKSLVSSSITPQNTATKTSNSNKKKNSANTNNKAQSYLKNSFRDLITLSQLPILSNPNSLSTAPSVLEKKSQTKPRGAKKPGAGQQQQQESGSDPRKRIVDDLYKYIYMIGTGVRNKKDPLEALGSAPSQSSTVTLNNYHFHHQKGVFSQRSINQMIAANHNQMLNYARKFRSLLTTGPMSKAKPRGVMWDMATDPSLAVTVFHLLERASVALPLGFLLMPFVRMIRHPLQGLDLNRFLPARASHRSVDYEELAKRLDVVDKMLSRALRQTHRESFISK